MFFQRIRLVARSSVVAVTLRIFLLGGIALGGGCGIDFAYLVPAAVGQIRLLLSSVPIAEAIERGRLSEAQFAKLEMIQDVRAYARDVMELNVGNNFTEFYDSGGSPVAFNVSACRKDVFEPRLWWFPIVGTVPYLGFFNRAAAEAKFDKLAEDGLDVFMYEIDAYSGIGLIPNIILSPMLERSETSIVQTVFHELLHSTIWRKNDTSFNESLATFYGRAGAVSFLTNRYPDQPGVVREAIERFEDVDRYTDFILSLFDELDSFYLSALSTEEKIAEREAIYQAGRERFAAEVQPLMNQPERYGWVRTLPANNAWMLGVQRYNLELDVFERVFAAVAEDWLGALEIFRDAASRSDPYGYLRAWLNSSEGLTGTTPSKLDPAEVDQHGSSTREPASTSNCPARLATTSLFFPE